MAASRPGLAHVGCDRVVSSPHSMAPTVFMRLFAPLLGLPTMGSGPGKRDLHPGLRYPAAILFWPLVAWDWRGGWAERDWGNLLWWYVHDSVLTSPRNTPSFPVKLIDPQAVCNSLGGSANIPKWRQGLTYPCSWGPCSRRPLGSPR